MKGSLGGIAVVKIRRAVRPDLEDLYVISLATGHHGGDATHLYSDPKLMGHIYSAPYLMLSPDTCFVAEDEQGVAGFAVGVISTGWFENHLEQDWWPNLRARYTLIDKAKREARAADQKRIHAIHYPKTAPTAVVSKFPSHLHLNLLPRLQGQGVGGSLLNAWLLMARNLGAEGVHVGVNEHNRRALRFWSKHGFSGISINCILLADGTIWLGKAL